MESAPRDLLRVAHDVCDRLSVRGAEVRGAVAGDGSKAHGAAARGTATAGTVAAPLDTDRTVIPTARGDHPSPRIDDDPTRSMSLVRLIDALPDAELAAMLSDVARLRAHVDAIAAAGAGVIARRSRRELGYSGLAQREGHRTPEAMLQSITGTSRAEARRQVKLGEAMGEADAARVTLGATAARTGTDTTGTDTTSTDTTGTGGTGADDVDAGDASGASGDAVADRTADELDAALPWFDPITTAVTDHRMAAEAGSAILSGLGEPNERVGADLLRVAALALIEEAARLSVDALRKRARFERDLLDPEGLELRAQQRYEARLGRLGHDAAGARTAYLVFDDESAAFVDTLIDAALRPRRGGPRFVDAAEAARAETLLNDSRTNEQLIFDLLIDTLRAGADADPSRAYGTRQPGVRIVTTRAQVAGNDSSGRVGGMGYYEHSREAAAGSIVERALCAVGARHVLVDSCGNPLDVGRDQRLFTASQRVALSIRDGGCLWPGCDRPPSYCEAHHIDHWHADHGRTDTRDGVLLCRHHHMLLHNNKWKIRRTGSDYWLLPPSSVDPSRTRIRLVSMSPLRYARFATG